MKLPPKSGRWIVISIAIIWLIVMISGPEGYISVLRSYYRLKVMKKNIATLDAKIDSLDNVVQRLHSDTLFVERIAREKLGMARKDERVFKFPDE